MGVNLSGRPFLRLLDFSTEEIEYLLEALQELQRYEARGRSASLPEGKNIVLLFPEDSSTCTAAHLKLAEWIWAWGVTILILTASDGQEGVH